MLPYMQRRIKGEDGIKVANQLSLRWGDYPEYAVGPILS